MENKLEQCLYQMREELKNAILNESEYVHMTFNPYEGDCDRYFAKVKVEFFDVSFLLTVAEDFICYHEPFTWNLFQDNNDLMAFIAIVKKYVKVLTDDEKSRIQKLQSEIDKIKNIHK